MVIEDATPELLYINDTEVPVITGGAPTSGVRVEVIHVTGPLAEVSPLAPESGAP